MNKILPAIFSASAADDLMRPATEAYVVAAEMMQT